VFYKKERIRICLVEEQYGEMERVSFCGAHTEASLPLRYQPQDGCSFKIEFI
jgi:rRNA maturation protein Nop10